ncbi:MAG: hypothetical protein ACK5MD_08755 [Flavobacteriales bacterium]
MNKQTEQKAKKRSTVITTIITVVVLCGLFFFSFKYYDPPIENAIVINFGYDEEGTGKEEPAPSKGNVNDNQASRIEAQQQVQREPIKEKVLTQEKESPVIKSKSKNLSKENVKDQTAKKQTVKADKTTEKSEKEKLDGRLSGLRGSLGGKGKSSSGGDGTGSERGNQGVLEGDPGAENYEGSIAKGTRKLINRPPTPDFNQCPNNEYGKLVVAYKVNAVGNIVSNTIDFNGKGTNITVNTCIKNIIKTYLSKFQYSKSNKTFEATSQTFNLKPK